MSRGSTDGPCAGAALARKTRTRARPRTVSPDAIQMSSPATQSAASANEPRNGVRAPPGTQTTDSAGNAGSRPQLDARTHAHAASIAVAVAAARAAARPERCAIRAAATHSPSPATIACRRRHPRNCVHGLYPRGEVTRIVTLAYTPPSHHEPDWRLRVIEVQDLRKVYGTVVALDGISFATPAATVYGLLGPNGAGKSTTISVLAGLVAATSGSAQVAGFDVMNEPRAAKDALGFVPQDVVLYDELDARENLEFFGGLYGVRGEALRQRVRELLTMIDLGDNAKRRVETYSGGMKRRLNLACGLVHRPKVLLLDEPTVGIDPQARLHILEMVEDIARQGTTVLYTTHYLHEAEELCDRIAIIDHGRILAEGTLEELRAQVGGRDLVHLRGRFDPVAARALIETLDDSETISVKDDEIVLGVRHGGDAFGRLVRGLASVGEAHEINIRQPSLESLFIKLTGRELRE
jgi:ABC-2 type transport system ATP-binding protein